MADSPGQVSRHADLAARRWGHSVSGYLGGWVDAVVSRLIDVLLSVPGLLLSMVLTLKSE